jgi:drug/metabolite transporter (DMT)-like permease
MRPQIRAYVSASLAVLAWSTVATAFKLALRHVSFTGLLFYASFFSTIVLAIILAARGDFACVFSYTRRQYLKSLGLGLLNPFLYYLILFKAYDLLPAQMAQPLNYTWAIALALLSVPLLGQRIGHREILGGVLGYVGVWVISTRGQVLSLKFANPLGVALALGSAFVWAFYWIGNTRDDRDPVAGLFLNFVMSLPFVLAAHIALSGWRAPTAAGLLATAYVGVVEMGATFVLWLTALRLSENTAKVGNLIFIAPFLSLVFIRSVLGEAILPSTYVGLALIVAGFLYQRVGRRGSAVPAGASGSPVEEA